MLSRRFSLLIVAAVLAVAPPAASADIELPPISYVCTMPGDEDVIEDHPGVCRKCGMTLVPIRLDSVWTCARQPLLMTSETPGKCPTDGTPLVRVTAALSWTCKDAPAVDVLLPGTCADGSAMIKKYSARAHGNHNPQHGGQFFMAGDAWHHLEGTLRPDGTFRAYLYNDFTKPLPLTLARDVSGVLVVKDPKSGNEKTLPLVRKGSALEATVGKQPFPLEMYAKVHFTKTDHDNRFDFTFDGYSKEPKAIPTATSIPAATERGQGGDRTGSGTRQTPSALVPASATIEVASGVDPALVPVPIPETVPEMLAQLKTRNEQVRQFIDKGMFAAIYVPAFQAKDLALALDEHKKELPPEKVKIAEPAIGRLVRSAYLLDAFGDLGNKQQIVGAYARFNDAVGEITSAFPGRP
jgi:Heavy metal binding domain